MNDDTEKWLSEYKSEYQRRIGITVADGGWSDQEILDVYFPEFDPVDAVLHQIQKYDLSDLTTEPEW